MPSPADNSEILIALSDYPGFFMQTAYTLAERLRARGLRPVFAVTSPFYPRFKGVRLEALGPVYDLSDFLRQRFTDAELDAVEIDWWTTYPTFLRTTYYNSFHPNPWDAYKKVALFFRHILSSHPHIKAAWSEVVSSAYLYLCYEECVRRTIPFLGFISARVPGHFNVQTDPYGDYVENPHPPADLPVANSTPDYMSAPNNNLTDLAWSDLLANAPARTLRALPGAWMRSLEIGNYFRYLLRVQRILFARKLRFWLIEKVARPFQSHVDFDDGRTAVLFPLQYRPEASTSVLAPHYESDDEIIRNVAFSLPPRATLFIKEHRSAAGIRSAKFYRRVLSYPNVRLLSVDFDLRSTLDRFDAVVTVTSTVGFEAIQAGVPVYLLGRCFYEGYPGVTTLESWSALRNALRQVTKTAPHSPRPEVTRRYLRHCYPGIFNYMAPSITTPENVERLAQAILDHVRPRHGS